MTAMLSLYCGYCGRDDCAAVGRGQHHWRHRQPDNPIDYAEHRARVEFLNALDREAIADYADELANWLANSDCCPDAASAYARWCTCRGGGMPPECPDLGIIIATNEDEEYETD